jgi:alpha-tubulin suppressor-like RCC1 family protein
MRPSLRHRLFAASVIALGMTLHASLAWAAPSLSAGEYHNCALIAPGSVSCWGYNPNGELGDGTTTTRTSPVSVSSISTATAVAAGGEHTCALISGGTVKCWGYNAYGQLGNGTTTDSSSPVSVSGLTNVTSVASGSYAYATCAVISDGTAKCWGDNYAGMLGDGTNTNRSAPVTVSGLSNVTQIAVGGVFTCALLSNGTVDCWGDDAAGELGYGGYYGSSYSRTTPGAVSGITGAVQIAVGYANACALLSDGSVKCWGSDYNGESGQTASLVPTPATVSGISGATSISAGEIDMCAVISDGTLKCWGWNGYGQLGNGTTTDSHTPVSVSGISSASQVAAGYLHTCALLSDDSVKCWGYNAVGEF